MKSNDSYSHIRLGIYAMLMILAISTLPITSALAETTLNNRNAVDEEGPPLISDPVAKVTIQKKVIEAVITDVGDKFGVSSETIITNLEGQQVSIREMLVPCDAEIIYRTEKGVRMAQRIKTIGLGRNTTWKWAADIPE